MDIRSLLKGHKCSCGKHHTCDIKEIYIENGAVNKVPDICKKYTRILLVADENTYAVGKKVDTLLGNKITDRVIFNGGKIVIPNEDAVDKVTKSTNDKDLIVGIGSGVIQDICKYVSFQTKIPYVIVATAPSMDGYASTAAAMIFGGMKTTFTVSLPLAIVADIDILKNAPIEMIKSGFGDILGKVSSLSDWKLSHIVTGESLCEYIYDTTYETTKKVITLADKLLLRDDECIKSLTEALIVVGIMMSYATCSRPASGSEHHLSHYFEITGIVHKEKYFSHGIDVGFSTVITAKLREELIKKPFSGKLHRIDDKTYKQIMDKIYGPVSDSCIELQKKIGNYAIDRTKIYKENEVEIKKVLSEVPKSDDIISLLKTVGLDMSSFYSMYSDEKIQNGILYAKDLKERYTVLWLYYDLL